MVEEILLFGELTENLILIRGKTDYRPNQKRKRKVSGPSQVCVTAEWD